VARARFGPSHRSQGPFGPSHSVARARFGPSHRSQGPFWALTQKPGPVLGPHTEARARFGPSHSVARARLGPLGPHTEARARFGPSHRSQGPFWALRQKPGPVWALAQCGQGPFGPSHRSQGPFWALRRASHRSRRGPFGPSYRSQFGPSHSGQAQCSPSSPPSTSSFSVFWLRTSLQTEHIERRGRTRQRHRRLIFKKTAHSGCHLNRDMNCTLGRVVKAPHSKCGGLSRASSNPGKSHPKNHW
jgi:hypothetical protein